MKEMLMFFFKALIEAFGQPVDIKGGADTPGHIEDVNPFLLLQILKSERDMVKFLDQRIAGLLIAIGMFPAGAGSARLAFYPLPYLGGLSAIDINNQMFVKSPGNLALNFPADGMFRNFASGIRRAPENSHSALLGNSRQDIDLAIDINL